MITTITTSTITSITSVTSTITTTAVVGLGVLVLGAVAVMCLVILLCAKELAAASAGRSQRILARFLDIGIVPLAIAFAIIVVSRIIEVLA